MKFAAQKLTPLLLLGLLYLPAWAADSVQRGEQPENAGKSEKSEAADKSFLWEVKSSTTTIYVLGALGMGSREIYPLPRRVEEAYKRAKFLVVESDVSDETKFGEDTKSAYYQEPDSIEQHLPQKLYERVFEYYARNNMPLDPAKQMKPYILAFALMNGEVRNQGFEPMMDQPNYFVFRAHKEGKSILELEGVPVELRALDSMAPNLQEALLEGALTTLEDGSWAQVLKKEVDAWREGDTLRYDELDRQSYAGVPMADAVREHMVFKRHPRFLEKLDQYLHTSDVYFVVMAAPHLVGERGIIQKLRAAGYQVTAQP